ncbi:hypothetical protein F4W66_24715 (plasmid) [Escherichia coli]|nr:hypothetical protein F4W66_24715 [Escherichia coli]
MIVRWPRFGPVYQARFPVNLISAMAAGFACLNEVAPWVHETPDEPLPRPAYSLKRQKKPNPAGRVLTTLAAVRYFFTGC